MDADNAGYEEVFPITIIDLDDTAPVITLNGDATVTHEGATAYTDEGADWTDTVDGSGILSAVGQHGGHLHLNLRLWMLRVGSYILTYDYTGDDGARGATAYTDEGADWTDTVDGRSCGCKHDDPGNAAVQPDGQCGGHDDSYNHLKRGCDGDPRGSDSVHG